MTIIAAYIDRTGHTAIGCDTMAMGGGHCTYVSSKLHRIGAAVVGCSGSNLWRRFLTEDPPALDDPADLMEFADGWTEWATERGHGEQVDGQLYQNGGFLVAFPGRLIEVCADGALHESTLRYAAMGSGQAIAVGALAIASEAWPTARDVLVRAIQAVMLHSPECGGDIIVEDVT